MTFHRNVQPKKLRKRTKADDERDVKLCVLILLWDICRAYLFCIREAKAAKAQKGKARQDGNANLGLKRLVKHNKAAASQGMAIATESDQDDSSQEDHGNADNIDEQPRCISSQLYHSIL